MAKRDYSEVLADWNVPPSFGPIAHLVGRARGRTTLNKKLSYTQAQEMRRVNSEQTLTTRELAKMFKVSQATVVKILNNELWAKENEVML